MKIRTVIVDDEPLAREGLRGLLGSVEGLPARRFVRLNRSLIVNLETVVALQAQGQGDYMAILRGGKKVSVTVGLRELEQRLRYG
jgi:DNA-binding LytR/AlgR family response regulator